MCDEPLEPAKGAPPLDIPVEPLAGCQCLFGALARLEPLCGSGRVQHSRDEPHSGPIYFLRIILSMLQIPAPLVAM
jgi:hypothetical protein